MIDHPRPVTGPDGENPITDEQLHELLEYTRANIAGKITTMTTYDRHCEVVSLEYNVRVALGLRRARRGWSRAKARTRCAAAYNDRDK